MRHFFDQLKKKSLKPMKMSLLFFGILMKCEKIGLIPFLLSMECFLSELSRFLKKVLKVQPVSNQKGHRHPARLILIGR